MDRGILRWATVHGVTKSLMQLSTHVVKQALSLLDCELCGYKNLDSFMPYTVLCTQQATQWAG